MQSNFKTKLCSFIQQNSTEVAFTVLITATREYDVFITADARLSYETTFMIQTEHPCDRISKFIAYFHFI